MTSWPINSQMTTSSANHTQAPGQQVVLVGRQLLFQDIMESIFSSFLKSFTCCVGSKGRGSMHCWKIVQLKEVQSQFSYWNTEQKGAVTSQSETAHTPGLHKWVRIQRRKAAMGQKTAVSFCTGTVSIYFGLKKKVLCSSLIWIKMCGTLLSCVRFTKVYWERNCQGEAFADLNFLEKFMKDSFYGV